jgi:flagellar biogenesis protein FliO
MTGLPVMTRSDFEGAVTPAYIGGLILIRTAMMGGVLLLCIVAAFLYESNVQASPGPEASSLMNILSGVNALMLFVSAGLAAYLSRSMLSKERLALPATGATRELMISRSLSLCRTRSIAMIAVLESAALFGGAICLIGSRNGMLQSEPMYWLNAIPACVFFATAIMTFPMRSRVIELLDNAFCRP